MPRMLFMSDTWHDQQSALSNVPGVRLEAFSMRSHIANEQDLCSQDVISIAYDDAQQRLAFCVCDGVSSSFAGHIAAQYLARHLADLLLKHADEQPMAQCALEDELRHWAQAAAAEVAEVLLPPEMNPLVRETLEETRMTRGSETVFLAGLLRWGAPTETSGDLHTYAMGNVRGLLISADSTRVSINARETDTYRWGTHHGPTGRLLIERYSFPRGHVRVATDGIEALDGGGHDAWMEPAALLVERATNMRATTEVDDLAVLDIWCPAQSDTLS